MTSKIKEKYLLRLKLADKQFSDLIKKSKKAELDTQQDTIAREFGAIAEEYKAIMLLAQTNQDRPNSLYAETAYLQAKINSLNYFPTHDVEIADTSKDLDKIWQAINRLEYTKNQFSSEEKSNNSVFKDFIDTLKNLLTDKTIDKSERLTVCHYNYAAFLFDLVVKSLENAKPIADEVMMVDLLEKINQAIAYFKKAEEHYRKNDQKKAEQQTIEQRQSAEEIKQSLEADIAKLGLAKELKDKDYENNDEPPSKRRKSSDSISTLISNHFATIAPTLRPASYKLLLERLTTNRISSLSNPWIISGVLCISAPLFLTELGAQLSLQKKQESTFFKVKHRAIPLPEEKFLEIFSASLNTLLRNQYSALNLENSNLGTVLREWISSNLVNSGENPYQEAVNHCIP